MKREPHTNAPSTFVDFRSSIRQISQFPQSSMGDDTNPPYARPEPENSLVESKRGDLEGDKLMAIQVSKLISTFKYPIFESYLHPRAHSEKCSHGSPTRYCVHQLPANSRCIIHCDRDRSSRISDGEYANSTERDRYRMGGTNHLVCDPSSLLATSVMTSPSVLQTRRPSHKSLSKYTHRSKWDPW